MLLFWSQNTRIQSAKWAKCFQQAELVQWLDGAIEFSRASLWYWMLYIVWHFNKIVVWISEVKRGDGPHSAAPLHWTVLYLDTTRLQRRQQQLSNLVSPTSFPNWNKMRDTKSKRPQVAFKDLKGLWLALIIQEALEESGWNTIRCAATVVRGVLVMRHRSAEPEVGCLALGSNSWPSWWRLNFCWPNPRALRSPLEMQRGHVLVLTRRPLIHEVGF